MGGATRRSAEAAARKIGETAWGHVGAGPSDLARRENAYYYRDLRRRVVRKIITMRDKC
jgi:hypothetical protein